MTWKWCKVAATKPLWTERGKRQQDNKIRKKKQKWKNQNCDFSIILFSSCDRAVTSTCMHLPCECATRPSAAIEVLASPGTRVRQVPCTATDMEQVPCSQICRSNPSDGKAFDKRQSGCIAMLHRLDLIRRLCCLFWWAWLENYIKSIL